MIVLVMTLVGCSGKEEQEASKATDQSQTKGEVQDSVMEKENNTVTTEANGSQEAVNAESKPTEEGKTADQTTDTQSTADIQTEVAPEATPVPEGLVLPLTTNTSGKVMIQTVSKSTTYPYNSYIITSVNGENIILDATSMPKKEEIDLNPAAILSTHSHPDHIDDRFFNAYECEKLLYKKGEINTKDFHIYTIQSAHDGDWIPEQSYNVIIVLEVDGLRIAHMGDIGQTILTEDQLKELGEIDIAFMQYENSYSNMSLNNRKGFNMMEQLKPKLIIPTHYTNAALPLFEEAYGTITEVVNVLEIAKEDIPDQTAMLRILNQHVYE